MADTSRLRGRSLKLKKERWRLDLRKFAFSQRLGLGNATVETVVSVEDEGCVGLTEVLAVGVAVKTWVGLDISGS